MHTILPGVLGHDLRFYHWNFSLVVETETWRAKEYAFVYRIAVRWLGKCLRALYYSCPLGQSWEALISLHIVGKSTIRISLVHPLGRRKAESKRDALCSRACVTNMHTGGTAYAKIGLRFQTMELA